MDRFSIIRSPNFAAIYYYYAADVDENTNTSRAEPRRFRNGYRGVVGLIATRNDSRAAAKTETRRRVGPVCRHEPASAQSAPAGIAQSRVGFRGKYRGRCTRSNLQRAPPRMH